MSPVRPQEKTLRVYYAYCLALLVLLPLCAPRVAQAEARPFAQLTAPVGVTTDSSGNVYVHSDAITTTLLTKFAPDGTALGQITLGGINVSEFVGSHLTRIPGTDFMLLLSPQGQIISFTPDFQGGLWIDLRPLANQVADGVYDVLTQQFRSLVLGFPHYGDIAAQWAGEGLLNVFVTATTGAAGGFPFVMRLQIDVQNNTMAQQVILTAQGTTAGAVNLPPGIAVNAAGQALTTLPFPIPIEPHGGFAQSLVAFGADFPENPNGVPRFILNDPQTNTGLIDFDSNGMTVDQAGNFYVATGVVGSTLCGGQGSGALVFINSVLTQLLCVPVGAPLVRSGDVAVSPVDNAVYMTLYGHGLVLRFDPIVPAQ